MAQTVEPIGFLQKAAWAFVGKTHFDFVLGKSAGQNYFDLRINFSQLRKSLNTIHMRHGQVKQYTTDFGAMLAKNLNRFPAIASLQNLETKRFKHHFPKQQQRFFVVYQQNCAISSPISVFSTSTALAAIKSS